LLTAGWLSPLRSAARVTLRSAINASNTTRRLRSTDRKFRSAMTSILLCHFPGGAGFGIIAPYAEAVLPTSIPDQSRGREARPESFFITINGLHARKGELAKTSIQIMPLGHDDRAYYHKAKYMPPKGPPLKRLLLTPELYARSAET
jgi:hypothetical protein